MSDQSESDNNYDVPITVIESDEDLEVLEALFEEVELPR